jgi:hypothetical protein
MHAEDRMYCYLWADVKEPAECKFGERFVKAGVDPEKDCKARIRESLGVQKGRFDDGSVKMIAFWDVSEAAAAVGRNKAHGKMDDFLRESLGYRKKGYAEVHELPAAEMQIRVNKLLHSLGQPLMTADLSTLQYKVAEEVLGFYSSGSKTVLASLCARFGKTVWSGAVAVELDVRIVVVATYVKTVITSFQNDLSRFEQFADYEQIEAEDPDSESKLAAVMAAGKKAFVYLSMANGSKRQSRIDFIFDRPESKMLIIDEADFGVHQANQAISLVDKSDQIDYILLMTGTNADRAVTHWQVDNLVSVTYPELLLQKKATQGA